MWEIRGLQARKELEVEAERVFRTHRNTLRVRVLVGYSTSYSRALVRVLVLCCTSLFTSNAVLRAALERVQFLPSYGCASDESSYNAPRRVGVDDVTPYFDQEPSPTIGLVSFGSFFEVQ